MIPVVTRLTNSYDAGPTSYTLNRPVGSSISVPDGYESLAIGQDTDYWYLQATTGPTTIGFTNSTMPFDDYQLSNGSGTDLYSIFLKDSNNALVLRLADSSYNPGVAVLTIPKALLSFNLPYS